MDILIRLLRSTFHKQAEGKTVRHSEFLDARFASLFARCYPKFKKTKPRNDYLFTKSIAGCLNSPTSHDGKATRFYLPFNVANKHWIGLCIDCPASKIYILDCNRSVRSDASLSKELRPIADMFLSLLKFYGRIDTVEGTTLSVERLKGVAQNTNPAEAGITSVLLMQAHALFGAEICRCITPLILTEEAQRAALMLYEFHALL